jgi:hypothetical protein
MYMPNPSTPKPPKKSRRNQPTPFTEAMTVSLPRTSFAAPVAGAAPMPATPADTNLRLIMITLWVLASLAAGIGLGLLLSPERQSGVMVTGWPVASQALAVSSAPSTDIAAPVAQPEPADLVVAPATAITQAEAGTPVASLALLSYQPALYALAVQPDFLPIAFPQGTVGTTPVR